MSLKFEGLSPKQVEVGGGGGGSAHIWITSAASMLLTIIV